MLKTSSCTVTLLIAAIIFAAGLQSSSAQFIACKIVNLNPSPPTTIQTGQPFQVTTNLTVSCDLSVLPIIRVTLRDAASSSVLSTVSIPYPSAASFVTSVVNQANARQQIGSWALEIEVDVISELNGQAFASTSQLFQVNVEPYTPPVTIAESTETTTQTTNTISSSTQVIAAATAAQNFTEKTESTLPTLSTESGPSATSELLIPAGIVFVGLLIFAALIFAARRRRG